MGMSGVGSMLGWLGGVLYSDAGAIRGIGSVTAEWIFGGHVGEKMVGGPRRYSCMEPVSDSTCDGRYTLALY